MLTIILKNSFLFSISIFFLSLLLLLIQGLILHFFGIELPSKSSYTLNLFTPIKVLILAPLIEEILFRLALVDTPNKTYLLVVFAVFSFVIINKYRKSNDIFSNATILLLVWIIILLINYSYYSIRHEVIFNKYLLCMISSIVFSISHYRNYNGINNYIIILPLIMLFIDSILLSLVRIKHGIVWSIFTHMLMNLLPAVGMIIKLYKGNI